MASKPAPKPAPKAPTKAVAKIPDNKSLALIDMEADQGAGFENADKDSYAIPFLSLLQKMSPQCDDSDGSYIKGAKPGMFLNAATGKLHETVIVIPCSYERMFVQWGDRDAGGGFKGSHKPTDLIVGTAVRDEKTGKMVLPGTTDYLMDTRYHYCLQVNPDGSATPVMVALKSTQLKKSRGWMTTMANVKMTGAGGKPFTPPTFSQMYTLSSVQEQNDQGSWKGIKIEAAGPVTSPDLYHAARAFRDQVSAGQVKVVEPEAEGAPLADDDEKF